MALIVNYLANFDFIALYNTTDVEQAWSVIKQCLTIAIDLFIPKIRLTSYQYPKWFSPNLKHQLKYLCTLRKRVHRHFTISKLQLLIQAEDAFQLSLSKAKSEYELGLINNYTQSKDVKLFHYINSITKSNSLPIQP